MKLQGRTIVKGYGKGPAMITDVPVNFTAAFTKTMNMLPHKRAEVQDRHHPWYQRNVRGQVLLLPACIGSTHTGLVLLDLVRLQNGPAGIVVGHADSLLVSGIVLSEVWYERAIPIVEYPVPELYGTVRDGMLCEVNGETGEIVIAETAGAEAAAPATG